MKRHKEIKHMGLKPFMCNVCGKQFTQKFHIRDHIKRKHTKDGDSRNTERFVDVQVGQK